MADTPNASPLPEMQHGAETLESESSNSLPSIDDVSTEGDEVDSAVDGMSSLSSTTSLRSSIYQHIEENGRTYHRFRQGKYMLPNDEQEQERLEVQHAMYLMSLGGKLHLAPIKPDQDNVLDMATGTGTWAIEFAQQYPNAHVLGTDLSAIQPLYIPTNCRFEIDDLEDPWIFPQKFSFIHGRALLSCFKDPKAVFQSAYEALEPGGWFEMQDMVFPFEFLGPPPADSALEKWCEIIAAGAAALGRPWTNVPKYKGWFEELGFEKVTEKKFYWPFNKWPKGAFYKELSLLAQADLLNGLEGLSLKVMGSQGWKPDDIRKFLVGVRKEVVDTKVYGYCPMRVVYGRKPLQG